jgi:AraC family transcriptional regulator, regulatory protein of adaptative response / methylated-DNA-[protein]-cysteine methyltransferase
MKLTPEIMYKAAVEKDVTFEGQFISAVKTTGIFCRPICTAKKPKFNNVEFFKTTDEALNNGYRPCKVCKPLEKLDQTPQFINQLIKELEDNPSLKIKDSDLITRNFEPHTIRRWFLKNYQMTFHAYQRMLRISVAVRNLQSGQSVLSVAYNSGYESLSGFNDSFKTILGKAPSSNKETKLIHINRIETPIGVMIACATEQGVCLLQFMDSQSLDKDLKDMSKSLKATIIQGYNKHLSILKNELNDYFSGKIRVFTTKIILVGTDLQKSIWKAILDIPYGQTQALSQLAVHLNRENSHKIISNSCYENKLLILVPSHRLINELDSLADSKGGNLRINWLMEFELKKK